MKFLRLSIVFLLAFFVQNAFGQVPNRTETNCDGVSQTLQQWLDNGKPMMIIQDQFDCENCQFTAAPLDSFANLYYKKMQFWASMDSLERKPGRCADIENWRGKYGWSNIFTFLDKGYWADFNAHYILLDPRDRSVYWKAHYIEDIYTHALDLMNEVPYVESADERLRANVNIYPNPSEDNLEITIEGKSSTKFLLQIIDLKGVVVNEESADFTQNRFSLDIKSIPSGIYTLKVSTSEGFLTKRFIKR